MNKIILYDFHFHFIKTFVFIKLTNKLLTDTINIDHINAMVNQPKMSQNE